jgi:membrane protein DedA with SNARE-associated domain
VIALPDLDVDTAASYLIALVLPALDAVVPLVPSETAVVGLGVTTAGETDPRLAVLVVLAAAGAFVGDNLSYMIGRRFGPWVDKRWFSGPRGKRRRAWAERTLHRHGARLIVVCRFVPGGRTAVTLTCGLTGYGIRSFRVATAAAGAIWATYAFLLGRLGGRAFEDRPWLGLLLALGLAAAVTVLVELGRRLGARRRPTADSPPT